MSPTPPLSGPPPPASRAPAGPGRDARSPEEAARQFESVLVRQFVEVMTKDLFDSEAEGMLIGQGDLQRDTLTDTLTDHLVESGTFGIADLMIAQWEASGRIHGDAPAPNPAPGASPTPHDRHAAIQDALRDIRALGAQGRPPSIDTRPDPRP